MTEKEFWVDLEFKITKILDHSDDREIRKLWCDGFLPLSYHLSDLPPQVMGQVWIAHNGDYQEKWPFRLVLDRRYDSTNDIPWESLLPESDAPSWFELDLATKTLRIDLRRSPDQAE